MKQGDSFLEIRKHKPFRLKERGLHMIQELVDLRENYQCLICGTNNAIQRHHVKYKSEGGEDRIDNLVDLCETCHRLYGHGLEKHRWQKVFREYLNSPYCQKFHKDHHEQIHDIYRRYWKEGVLPDESDAEQGNAET